LEEGVLHERPSIQIGPRYTYFRDSRDDVVSVRARQAQLPQRLEMPWSNAWCPCA
jgi:hypothetical protein